MLNIISEILEGCKTKNSNICPTILYNEGWMTRLLVKISINAKLKLRSVDFGKIRHWYSEGLLSSPFLKRNSKDKLAEGYTHADMALGDFHIDPLNRGIIRINGKNGIFGVIEAKMGSNLSQGTRNAPRYDQASRNLACIAFNTIKTSHRIFFAVVAPEKKIEEYEIEKQVNISTIARKIYKRFEMYKTDPKVYAYKEPLLNRVQKSTCLVLSYETWLKALKDSHCEHYSILNKFKNLCYKYNKILQ